MSFPLSSRPSRGAATGSPMRGTLRSGLAALAVLSLLLVSFLTDATSAFAYWRSSGTGTAASVTGTLLAPSAVTVPGSSTKNVPVSWSASAGATIPAGYVITRTSGSTTVAACASSAAAPITGTSCTDAAVPDGSYTYVVTAVYRSWTARSTASSSVTVTTPTKLAFTVQPSNTIAGATITPAVTVALQTAAGAGAPLAGITVTLTLSSNPGSATLSGSPTAVTDATGRATFSGLSLGKAAAGYVLTAASAGLTSATSSAFTITAGPAAKLVYISAPVTGFASSTATIGPVTVQRQDAFGNPVTTGAASLSLTTNTTGVSRFSATSGGTAVTSLPIANGSSTASFYYGDTRAGTPTITASVTGLDAAAQTATITHGVATKLVFGQQPTDAQKGRTIAPAVTALIVDAFGNTVTTGTSSTSTVSIAIKNDPSVFGLAALGGTVPLSAVAGVATFDRLSINTPFGLTAAADGYTVEVRSTNLVSATSDPFDITN